jgi:hypothetical protein
LEKTTMRRFVKLSPVFALAGLLLCHPGRVFGVSTTAAEVGNGGSINLCNKSGGLRTTCHASWSDGFGNSGTGSSLGSATYTKFKTSATALATTTTESSSAQTYASGYAYGGDGFTITFQNIPTGNVFFKVSISLTSAVTGSFGTGSGFGTMAINVAVGGNGSGAGCTLRAAGTCSAKLILRPHRYNPSSASFNLYTDASSEVSVTNPNTTVSGGSASIGQITAVEVVDPHGNKVPGVTITSSSGHVYPE